MADNLTRDAERIVLGAMMLDGSVIPAVAEKLRSPDFSDVRHATVFAAIVSNYRAGAQTDPVGVAITLNGVKELQRVGGGPVLHDMVSAVPTAASATWYAAVVAEAAKVRSARADAARFSQVVETGDLDQIAAERARLAATVTVDPPAQLSALTLRERLAQPQSPLAWRIEDWQPAGSRVVLAAQYKAGKTTAVGNLLRCLVDGDPFLGRHKVQPVDGTVALLDFEMSANQLDDWLRAQQIVNDDQVIVLPLRGAAGTFDLIDPGVRARWVHLLRQRECRYVVWDCFRPVMDALGLDEQREAGKLLTAFDSLLYDAQIPDATLVHHMGHTGERSRGDSRLRDWPDVEWRLVRQEPDDPASARFLSAFGRDVDQGEAQLVYDPATRHLILAGGTRKDAVARLALVDILDALAATPGLSVRQIQQAVTEHPRDNVRAAIKVGVRDRLILTEAGPRRSVLHRHVNPDCASARECAASVRAQSCECAAALYRAAHSHTRSTAASVRAACQVCGEPIDPVLGTDIHPLCEEQS